VLKLADDWPHLPVHPLAHQGDHGGLFLAQPIHVIS
jgi:hypothetical protein